MWALHTCDIVDVGATRILYKHGMQVQINADGHIIQSSPDGTITQQNPDGSVIEVNHGNP